MSMIKDHTTTTTTTTATTKPPSTSARRGCFLGCFGFKDKKVNSNSRRSKWISKLKFSFKKTKGKTVPVDQTTVTNKSKSEKLYPAKSSTKWEIQVVEDDAKLNTKWADSVKLQNGSFRSRRKETKAAVAKVDLPEKKTVAISTHPLKPLTHLEALPQHDKKKLLPALVVKGFPEASDGNKGRLVKKTTPFDSMAGMSIILVTLVIMMLWGKLCAILCTCAWFFIAPRLDERVAVEKQWPELDLESVEYKKKVVLEGLLQRNHRNNVVGRL